MATLATLVEELARRMRDFEEQTATGGSTTTVVDTTNRTEADDYWNESWVYIRTTTDGNAPQGEERKVTDFTASSDTLTVAPAFSAAVESGDTYWLFKRFRFEEYKRAINAAIRSCWPYFFEKKVDEDTLVVCDDTLKYTLPSGVKRLAQVYIENVSKSSSGTANGTQSDTTLQDTDQSWTVNEFDDGYKIALVDGTGKGQQRTISSNTSDTITVSSAWTTNPVDGDTEYVIKDVGDEYAWVQIYDWRVEEEAGTQYLRLNHYYLSGMTIKLVYEKEHDTLSAITDTTNAPMEYIMLKAMAELYRMMMVEAPEHTVDTYRWLMQYNEQMANEYIVKYRDKHIPGTVHHPEKGRRYSSSENPLGW